MIYFLHRLHLHQIPNEIISIIILYYIARPCVLVVYTCQETNPCQNGGTCFEVKAGDVRKPEVDDSFSSMSPIQLSDKYVTFQCICPYGYRGPLCQHCEKIIYISVRFASTSLYATLDTRFVIAKIEIYSFYSVAETWQRRPKSERHFYDCWRQSTVDYSSIW